MLKDLLFRLRCLFRRREVDEELQEELRFHLEHEAEKYINAGDSKEEANRRARLAFGGPAQVAEACRDARGVIWVETIWKDIRYAIRGIRAHPLFALTAVASLALGIGANTSIFSLLRTSLWKPLPIEKPGEIFHLQRLNPSNSSLGEYGISNVLFQQLSHAAQPFGELVATSGIERIKFGISDESREHAVGQAVSCNFFSALKVQAYAGRTFEAKDDHVTDGRPVAVLSYAFWKNRLASDRSALGRTILYKEKPYTVIGIAQPPFAGVEAEAAVDVWVPLSSDVPKEWLTDPDVVWLRVLARLHPDAVPEQAEAVLDTTFRVHLTSDLLPGLDAHWRPLIEAQHLRLRPASAGLSTTGRKYEQPLIILMTAAAFVLLICCANVANMALARTRAREGEIAMRRALGASQARIISQLFTEALLLALCGAGLGVILAGWTCRLLVSLLPNSDVPLAYDLQPDFAVVGFALMIGIGTAVLFGLLPSLRLAANQDARNIGCGARITQRSIAGRILVVGQLAISLLLLVGAGLFIDTFRNLKTASLGFRPEQMTTFSLSFPKGTAKEHVRRVYDQIVRTLEQSSNVSGVTYAWPDLFSGEGGWSGGVEVEGRSASSGEDNEAGLIAVGPNFFQTIRLGLLQGRYPTERDLMNSLPVAVVNESLARHYFGNESAIGHRIKFPGESARTREIIGVVRDAKHYGARAKAWPMIYTPAFQEGGDFLVRSNVGLAEQGKLIRSALYSVDPAAQVEQIRTLESIVDDVSSRERMIADLSAVSSALALVLASMGLYGVMAYNVARRTVELGIRMALGARKGDVWLMVLRESIWLLAAGTAIGVGLALTLTRFVSASLYGVEPTNVGIFLSAVLVLALVGLIAALIPAWRASRVDPIAALRPN